MSTVNIDPSTLFGGVWAPFAQGRTLIGVGTSDRAFGAGETGGESDHRLVNSEVPSHSHSLSATGSTNTTGNHNHSFNYKTVGINGSGSNDDLLGGGSVRNVSSAGNHSHTVSVSGSTSSSGGGGTHNNLQPYIVTYMWTRTA